MSFGIWDKIALHNYELNLEWNWNWVPAQTHHYLCLVVKQNYRKNNNSSWFMKSQIKSIYNFNFLMLELAIPL